MAEVRFVGIDLGVTCVVASSTSEERNAITINTNDVSGRSTPSAVSYDGKLRHVGVNAEGRLMSAPKQTLSHLPLALVPSEAMQKRADKYQFLFPFQEDGTLGPVSFDGDSFAVRPAGPLASCIAVPDYYSDAELAVVHDALKLCETETVQLKTKSGVRLANEAMHALKHLSMLPDAEMGEQLLVAEEAFLPEGPDGPEIDVSVPLTRQVREVAGELPVRFGLDGASCVATGAAAWAAGKRLLEALDAPMEGRTRHWHSPFGKRSPPVCFRIYPSASCPASCCFYFKGLAADVLETIREKERKIEAIHSEEVQLGYLQTKNGKDGGLLNPDVLNPYLDKTVLWFEDADMAEEPTTFQTYSDKLTEVEEFIKKEGAPYFEKKAKDADERVMKKEDRMRLALKNKDEGNDSSLHVIDMFKAQKFDDVGTSVALLPLTALKLLNELLACAVHEPVDGIGWLCKGSVGSQALGYIKAGEAATQSGGKNAAEPFYKKAQSVWWKRKPPESICLLDLEAYATRIHKILKRLSLRIGD
eukprot:Skav231577  [mRNA]  locus=scaffold481:232986:240909:- [translate_table: standard]